MAVVIIESCISLLEVGIALVDYISQGHDDETIEKAK